jgi:hypothetical protein
MEIPVEAFVGVLVRFIPEDAVKLFVGILDGCCMDDKDVMVVSVAMEFVPEAEDSVVVCVHNRIEDKGVGRFSVDIGIVDVDASVTVASVDIDGTEVAAGDEIRIVVAVSSSVFVCPFFDDKNLWVGIVDVDFDKVLPIVVFVRLVLDDKEVGVVLDVDFVGSVLPIVFVRLVLAEKEVGVVLDVDFVGSVLPIVFVRSVFDDKEVGVVLDVDFVGSVLPIVVFVR